MDNSNQSKVNEVREPSEKYNGNPQVEEGFTRISNELLEALAKAMAQGIITARERAVIDWIIRYTYGYQQKNGYFHTSFIAKNLGLSISWVSQILKSLENKKIIIREEKEIQINKHYLEWSKQESLEQSKHLEHSKYLEPSKHLEQSKQYLEHSKHCLEPSKQPEPTTAIENEAEAGSKENIYKENNIKKTIDSQNVSSSFLKDEKDLKDNDIVGREDDEGDQEIEKKIAQIYSIFEKVMEAKYGTGYRVSYREYAEALAEGYSLDVIERVLAELKKRTQKERPKDWRQFVNPKSLSKKIDDILAEEKKETQEVRNYGW
jgi:phage replication O-like protein O